MRKIILSCLAIASTSFVYSQTVTNFMDTESNGCSGLTTDENYVYVVSSFDGVVHRKALTSVDSSYETFFLGGSGYTGICKIGDFVYVSKPANGEYGIYRFDVTANQMFSENFINMSNCFGLTNRNSELYFSAADKIYKVDLNLTSPAPVQIAQDINGTAGFFGSTMGIKIFNNFLYYLDESGIWKINLDSGNFEKEFVVACSGSSFTKGAGQIFYVTNENSVFEINAQNQSISQLIEIPGFVGTYDIVSSGNSLFVTAIEGSFNEVARIELNQMSTIESNTETYLLYPNPVKDLLTATDLTVGDQITIINSGGQLVKKIHAKNGTIDVSDLKSGTYFLKNNNIYRRFIKQ